MEKQLDMHAIGRDRHWLNIAESLAVIGSVGGSVAAIFLQEIVLVSIPLSACIAFLTGGRALIGLGVPQDYQTHSNSEYRYSDSLGDRLRVRRPVVERERAQTIS